jgi:hypothetical protein
MWTTSPRLNRPLKIQEKLAEQGMQEALLRSVGMTSLVRFATVSKAEWSSPVICLERIEELISQQRRKD